MICIYCGAWATGRDHIKPRSPRTHHLYSVKKYKGRTVPACTECNVNLKDFPKENVRAGAIYLIDRYEQKLKESSNAKEVERIKEKLEWLRRVAEPWNY